MATIALFPEPGAWGPLNNLVALAEVLRERGHRCVFVLEESFAGVMDAKGFEERTFAISAPADEADGVVGDVWVQYIQEKKHDFRTPTFNQITTVLKPIWEELISANEYAHDALEAMFAEIRPDLIVHDNVSAFPAVTAGPFPWVRMVSANPLEIRDPDLPPPLSGLPVGDRSQWAEWRAEYLGVTADLHARFSELCESKGGRPLPAGEFHYESPWLNLYLFADAADYPRSRPLGPSWHRLNTTVRTGEALFDVDAHLPGTDPLLYLSLGSLGSLDVELMQRLCDALADGPYRVIVSKGTLHEQISLHANQHGAEYLPQPSILPHADLLLTHGGNNTLNEGFHFGLPMIALPLFWDQYDNAQLIEESGFGVRLQTYEWKPEELRGAVDRLLADTALRERMRELSASVKAAPGQLRGADLIEEVLHSSKGARA